MVNAIASTQAIERFLEVCLPMASLLLNGSQDFGTSRWQLYGKTTTFASPRKAQWPVLAPTRTKRERFCVSAYC
jgi:hypothetical protein